MKAYLNGIELTPEAADTNNIRITYNANRTRNYIERITFSGWAYDLIKTELIDNNLGYLNSLPFKVEKTCCGGGIVFDGAIYGDVIEWDSKSCLVSAQPIQEDDESEAYRKIQSKTITEDLRNDGHPWVWATSGRNFFAVAVTFLAQFLFNVILSLVGRFLLLLETFLGDNSDLYENFTQLSAAYSQSMLLGLGQRAVMPYVRNIVEDAITPEGLTFESSILNESSSLYYNAAYLSIQTKPYLITDPKGFLKKENLPVLSLEQFLNQISQVFNASWEVKGTTLYFERRDNLPESTAFDISGERDLFIEFSWTKEQKKAYFDLQYVRDSTDKGGNEDVQSFDHIEEWNAAANENQRGAFEVNPPFSAHLIDFPYSSQGIGSLAATVLAGSGVNLDTGTKTLELSENFAFAPKIIPVDETASGFLIPDDDRMKGQTIYDNFYAIEDPNESGFRGLDFTATFNMSCGFIELIQSLNTVLLPVGNNVQRGYVNNIEIDFTRNTARINGEL